MKKRFQESFLSYLMVIAGAAIAALAVEVFLVDNSIFDGGVVGVSMILSHFIPVKLGVLTVIINIPFLVIALKAIGKDFLIKAIIAMVIFSLCTYLFESIHPITEDMLLATVFGGVILGIGVGLVLRGGGCLDGTEIVGILISKRTSLSVGRVVLLINLVIYTVAGIVFGINSGLYSIIMYFLTSKVIDLVETGLEKGKAVMIVTDNGRKVADEIYTNFGRTVTFIKGEGLISKTGKDILYCVVTRAEIYSLRKLISSLDVNAFTTVSDVSEIIGDHIKKTGN